MGRLDPRLPLAAVAALGLWNCDARSAAGGPPLVLERTIPLAGVKGRIDHIAVDTTHGRLFVAELGDGSIEALDIASGRSLGRVGGLGKPQGLAYLADRDELAVATGGDGTLRFYRAADLSLAGSVKLGDDADNVRVDRTSGKVVVGYGSGALAVIDPATRRVLAKAAVSAHPEGFQLEGGWAYVNVPDAGRIEVVDIASGRQLATWPNGWLKFNFSLALDPSTATLASVFRFPAMLGIFDIATGARRQTLPTCGDVDDVFFDHKRKRLYVVCGSGQVDVFGAVGNGYARLGRITSRGGARTGFFAPELDRLFVAARAGVEPAAILVYRPAPP
jgi:DNA-binding beta-propeller fold protein YncE